MSNKLKPVQCGCGGKADAHLGQYDRWFVFCESCGTRTCAYNTRKKAIKVWNRAMSGQNKKKDMTFHWIESFFGYRCSSCGYICNTTAMPDICPNCHARLEWN